MRCPKCNDLNFGDFAIQISKEGWYKGVTPAQLEVIICQKCGYRDNFVVTADAIHQVWIAQWKPKENKDTIDLDLNFNLTDKQIEQIKKLIGKEDKDGSTRP